MPVQAVLFSEMTPPPALEDAFNDWYNTEHIPVRMDVDGFVGAQRYKDPKGPGYLAIYDLNSPDVLGSDAYKAVKANPSPVTAEMLGVVQGFTRYTGELLGWQVQEGLGDEDLLASPYVYSVLFSVPADRQAAFNEWYEQEHVPLLLGSSQWLGCRRYRIVDGEPAQYTHLAIHHLSSLDALESDARAAARATDWRARLAAEPWFKGTYLVYERLGDRFRAGAPRTTSI